MRLATWGVFFTVAVTVTGQRDGLDLSSVLDTLYKKVEANMIKTIKRNLGGKNSLIKPKEKVNCNKSKFSLNPKCIKRNLSKRMRKLEKSLKVVAGKDRNINSLKTELNKQKKTVDEFIAKYNKATTDNNNTEQLQTIAKQIKTLDTALATLNEKAEKGNKTVTELTNSLNVTLTKFDNQHINMTAQNNLDQVVKMVNAMNVTIVNQADTIEKQEENIKMLENVLNITRSTTTELPAG